MSNIDLLNTVLASDGYYCIVGIKNKKVKPFFYTAREDLDAKADELVKSGQDVYFALAKFESDVNRKKENVKALKSFWVDIDCGEAKAVVDPKSGRPDGYIDQTTAIEELAKFCELVGLPIPLLVNSGRGIHAYWPLTRDVTRAEWEPVAERLAELCRIHKFYADPNVFEAARILRIPGTLNFKEDPPLPVEVINEAEPIKFEVFRDTLGVKESVVEVAPRRELTDLGKQLQENLESSFSKIMRRSAEHNGCKQILDCYQNQATLSEPRWFNALSVAKFCRDADSAIHKMSSGHPDYNPSDTEAKIQHIKGPHTCEQFEKNNPGGCEGCPFKGKIGSPISLGKELIMAEPEQESESESIPSNPAFQVPNYPFPFARGKNGGIYFVPEEDDPKLVYEHDIYVTKRMKDPQIGEVFVLRRHLPQDGVEEFLVPASSMVDKKELQRIISSTGVLCRDKPLELLLWMLISMAKDLQTKQRVLHMRLQFGWADNDSKFIIGDREITKDGVFHSPPSSTTQGLAQFLVPKGTIEKWKEVFKLYGKPGLEPNAYAALTAFGAPLLKFTGQKGSIINVIHPSSGTGKTTSLHMCNSVYGAPDRLYATKEDTLNAKITRLGIMNNLPFTCDEITNTTAEDFSTLAYSMSQGRGKDRMMSQTNQLRLNVTSWQTISLCSSNASMYERMAASKARPDGEMMRLLEYKIDYSNAIDVGVAKQMFDHQLMENYGHAGEIYISWLVNNLEEVVNTLQTIQAKIDRELSLTQRERCWSANVAANITGGLIAKQLELIDWDMKGIYKWITSTLVKMRDEVVAPVTDSMAVIGNFVNSHMQNVLVVNGDIDRRSNMATFPVMEPRGELIIRYEPDTKKLFICTKKFKADCDKFQNNYSEIVKDLKARGILLENKIKRMSKGMKLDVPGVIAMTLDASHPDFIDLDPVLHTQEPNNASGEHTVQG
jgi:hypothetical protein